MKIFNFDVAIGGTSDTKYNIKKVQFGNGYEQRQKQGVTPILETWKVSKTGTKQEIDEVKAFLDEHGGVTAFLWRVTSDEPYKKYVASGYTRTPKGGGVWQISFEMREVLA